MSKRILIPCLICAALMAGMIYYTLLAQSERQSPATSPFPASLQPKEGVEYTPAFALPVPGSAPTTNITHTIPLSDIRQGCFRQDCIPSVDQPRFVTASTLTDVLKSDSLGIVVPQADRFYPFPMLETHEIVNDFLPDGTPIAVTYCPLCGTGIVFNRELDGEAVEFGVSGMLWQSNLLMYNRAADIADRNLWSQVLGQAVVGERAGQHLPVVASDIITFADWLDRSPEGQTLTTGTPRDPYGGDYFATARVFQPDFDVTTSVLEPTERVHGIIVNGQPKAYVTADLFHDLTDVVAGERIFVSIVDERITFLLPNAERGMAPTVLPDVEGFWFSWAAARPETELWRAE